MRRNHEISAIGHPLDIHVHLDWEDDSTTIVEPFLLTIRKMEAPPGDPELEDLEQVRSELHQHVDRVVDRALESVSELRAIVERTQDERDALNAELECVVRHSNALVQATPSPPVRRRKTTVLEFPLPARAAG
jgi:hypothetical protein